MKDYALAKKSYKEEKKAVSDYNTRRDQAKDEGLKKTFTHAKNEEEDHAKMFKKHMKESEKKRRSERKYSDTHVELAENMRNRGVVG